MVVCWFCFVLGESLYRCDVSEVVTNAVVEKMESLYLLCIISAAAVYNVSSARVRLLFFLYF